MSNILDITLPDNTTLRYGDCVTPSRNQLIRYNGCYYIIKDRIFCHDENRVVLLTSLCQGQEGK